MIIKSADFITSAVKPSQYPEEGLPEIAFAGRSNVGKSSLINLMLNRKSLAKVSSSPGKTRTINFFNINNGEFRYLADYSDTTKAPEVRERKEPSRKITNREDVF